MNSFTVFQYAKEYKFFFHMQSINMFTLLFLFSFTSLYAQSEKICRGDYESILHDSNSGIKENHLSIMEVEERGYKLTLKKDKNKIIITQNNKKETYIKDEKSKYKYTSEDKTKYLLYAQDTYNDLYMYTKDLFVKYNCKSDQKEYEEHIKEEKYAIFSKFIKKGQTFLFEKEKITLKFSNTDEASRWIDITHTEDKNCYTSLWCMEKKKNYLDGLTTEEEEDFVYYVCADCGGKVEIKVNSRGLYLIPRYISFGILPELSENVCRYPNYKNEKNNTFIKGILIK